MSQSVKAVNSGYNDLVKAAQKCGFLIMEGGKHCKVKTADSEFVTTIPRHNTLKRETVKGIIKAFASAGCDIVCQ